jgi:hypothetical protein
MRVFTKLEGSIDENKENAISLILNVVMNAVKTN